MKKTYFILIFLVGFLFIIGFPYACYREESPYQPLLLPHQQDSVALLIRILDAEVHKNLYLADYVDKFVSIKKNPKWNELYKIRKKEIDSYLYYPDLQEAYILTVRTESSLFSSFDYGAIIKIYTDRNIYNPKIAQQCIFTYRMDQDYIKDIRKIFWKYANRKPISVDSLKKDPYLRAKGVFISPCE